MPVTEYSGPLATRPDPETEFQVARWVAWKDKVYEEAGFDEAQRKKWAEYNRNRYTEAALQKPPVSKPTDADVERSRVPMPQNHMLDLMRQYNLMDKDAYKLHQHLYYNRWDATPGGDPRVAPQLDASSGHREGQ